MKFPHWGKLKVVEDSEVKTAKTCRQKRNEDRRKVTEEK
jgi:hypothetical protein